MADSPVKRVQLKVPFPTGRNEKQAIVGFCLSPDCRAEPDDERFEFNVEHWPLTCPKCGADRSPLVGALSLVHLLVKDPKGKIVGFGGIRMSVACDAGRSHLATPTNQEAMTGDPNAVNCPSCLKVAVDRNMIKPQHGYLLIAGDKDDNFTG